MNLSIQIIKKKSDAIAAGISFFLGILVLAGWLTKSTALVQILPQYSPMQFNTALTFVICSSVILLRIYFNLSFLLYLFASIVMMISGLTFVQHIFEINTGIDTLILTPFTNTQTLHPGRMSLMTTSAFLLSSFPLLIITLKSNNRIQLLTGIIFSVLIIALGLGNISGYLLGQSTPYAWSHSGYMAVHTSLGFISLGISLYLYLSKVARTKYFYTYTLFTLIPTTLLLITTTLILWTITFSTHNILLNNLVYKDAHMFSSELSDLVESHKIAFNRMMKRWNRNNLKMNRASWPEDAKDYLNTIKGLKNLIIASQHSIKYNISNSNRANNTKLDDVIHKAILENSVTDQKYIATDNASVILLKYPINYNRNSTGYLYVVYDLKVLFEFKLKKEQIKYAVKFYDDIDHIYFQTSHNNKYYNLNNKATIPFTMFSTNWYIEFYPLNPDTSFSNHWLVLMFGLLFSGILILLLYQRHQNQYRSVTLAKVNSQLNKEVEQRSKAEKELQNHKTNLESIVLKRTVEVYKVNQDLEDEIDKRKISERQLIEANSRFEQFSNNTPHVIWLIDVKTHQVIYVNPAFEKIWGFTQEQLYSYPKIWMSKIHSDDLERVRNAYDAAITTGESENYTIEYRITTENGNTLWIHDHGNPILDNNHNVTRFAGITEDITLRKNTELALRDSEENYRQIIETTDQGIIVIDPMTNIQFMNTRMTELLNISDDKTLTLSIENLIIHDNYSNIENLFKIPSSESRRIEITFRDSKGEKIDTKVCITSIFSGVNNKVYKGSLILVTDISNELFAAQEHQALQRQLQQSQKMESIGQLTGGIAHDFNNILSSVIGFTELSLEQNESKDKVLGEFLSEVLIAGERAQELVQQMLTFSRGTAGKLKPLSASPLIKETIKLLRPTIPSSLIIKINIEPNVPDIQADVVQFHQLLMNLCINARDAMNGIGNLTVTLTHTHITESYCSSCFEAVNGEFAVLSIEDTGDGINADKISAIFEPFYTTKDIGKGSGMGLSMVHGITHDHDGHIIVNSVPNKGSIFEILFPLNTNVMRKTSSGF